MFLLLGLGLQTIASISNVEAVRQSHGAYHFIFMQAVFAVGGLITGFVVMCVRPSFWFRSRTVAVLAVLILLGIFAPHLPVIGHASKGAARWIRLGPISVQPSEFIKLAAIVAMSWWVGVRARDVKTFRDGIFVPGLAICAIAIGLFFQHDLGSIVLLLTVNGAILFLAKAKIRYILACALVALLAIGVWVAHSPERMSRITSVWGDSSVELSAEEAAARKDDTHQKDMSILAIRRGGLHGRGLGNSEGKQKYLPEAHTDFILAMVGEELGFAGTGSVLLLFLIVFACGMEISCHADGNARRFLAFGMTLHLTVSALVNMGVVTGILPTKGLALPFLSYGGSNLVASCMAIGFLMGIGLRPDAAPEITREPQPRSREATNIWNV